MTGICVTKSGSSGIHLDNIRFEGIHLGGIHLGGIHLNESFSFFTEV
ncbi:hypothetical protein MmiEs2_04480 [Methanimicrococcus stummii]|uniref:Uncharacterized protein n=1 Tax=Methanimicrococcus stummii TaxID=3028294 RepID=A0AA96ZWW3_9EURY|nr:hypothetical protein [Methanimicrococcus sp. Es2]WNY28264.1 hypothetical protein MmiEs2_04480 [Methanimicrococcus sp. Es2]